MFQLVCIWITTWGVERLWTNIFFEHPIFYNSTHLNYVDLKNTFIFVFVVITLNKVTYAFGTFKLCYHFPLITILLENHLKVYFNFCEFGLMLIILCVHVCNNICITNLLIEVFYIVNILFCPLSYICTSMSK